MNQALFKKIKEVVAEEFSDPGTVTVPPPEPPPAAPDATTIELARRLTEVQQENRRLLAQRAKTEVQGHCDCCRYHMQEGGDPFNERECRLDDMTTRIVPGGGTGLYTELELELHGTIEGGTFVHAKLQGLLGRDESMRLRNYPGIPQGSGENPKLVTLMRAADALVNLARAVRREAERR